jgi:hypothetical protein
VVKLKTSLQIYYGHHHDLATIQLQNICVTDEHRYVPFIIVTIPTSLPLSWLTPYFLTGVTQLSVTNVARTAYPSGAPELAPFLMGYVLYVSSNCMSLHFRSILWYLLWFLHKNNVSMLDDVCVIWQWHSKWCWQSRRCFLSEVPYFNPSSCSSSF